MPEADGLWELHRALLAGVPTAPDAIARAVLDSLAEKIAAQFPRVDSAITEQAVLDAVWEYLQRPETCRAETGDALSAYLRGAARNMVLGELRSDRRRHGREERWGWEAAAEAESDAVELSGAAATLEREEVTAALQVRRSALLQALNSDIDRRLLELRLSGERKTAAFAKVLAVTHLPIAEQRRIVKQHKDRIDKIVRRAQERS